MPKDKLYFYSKSRDAVPGYGVNEDVESILKYDELKKIPHWRRILSNFYEAPFSYSEKMWMTIEHAFQAQKIALVDPELAETFTIDSGESLGMGSGLDARKARKIAILSGSKLNKWNSMKHRIMEEIVEARYMSDHVGADVLIKTCDAELWHGIPRGKPMRMFGHEKVRNKLQKK